MAKKYTVPGMALDHIPSVPERTAKRTIGDFIRGIDTQFQVWPNRSSMAKSIRMQEQREHRNGDWKPCLPLSPGEGY